MRRPGLKFPDLLIPVALCAAWVVIQLPHLRLDPWNDELFTLQHFVLVPLERSITDYPVPNNHILFSLCLNLARRAFGIGNIQSALDHIRLIRLAPLVFSLGAIATVYVTALRHAGRTAALLAAVLLMGCVPFYNYACQLRGYGLSMLLLALLVYQIFSERPVMAAIVATTAAFLWVLPSNIYLLASLTAGLLLWRPRRGGTNGSSGKRRIVAGTPLPSLPPVYIAVLGMISGGCIGAMLYAPVFDELVAFSSGRGAGISALPLTRTLPVVLWHVLSGRWPLLLLPVAYLAVRAYHRQVAFPERLLAFASIGLLGPFLISALRGEGAPDRVFLNVLPLICLAWGVLSGRAIEAMRRRTRLVISVAYVVCCGLALLSGWWRGMEKVYTDRLRHERCADLYYQYYLLDFTPRADAGRFAKQYRDEAPVVNAAVQDIELVKYLRMEGLQVLPADSLYAIASRQAPVFAIMDGPALKAGPATMLPVTKTPGALRLPGIYRISWRNPDMLR